MTNPATNRGNPVKEVKNGRAIQFESPELTAARAEMRKNNVRKRGGVHICCERCGQLLAISYGDHLDCFAFTVAHRVKMKCEACGHENRWGPGKATAFNEKINTEAPKIEDAPLPKEFPKVEQPLDGDKEAE